MCPTVACSEQVYGFIGLMYSVYTITLFSPSIWEPICSGPGTFYAKSTLLIVGYKKNLEHVIKHWQKMDQMTNATY